MSRPRLNDSLEQLFSERDPVLLDLCLNHPNYEVFLTRHELKLPLKELSQAFTHTSFSHEYSVPHQEQLEFLGDSVLQLILTHELCERFPGEKEGKLSKMRSSLVNEKILAGVAASLNLSELILVGKGEYKKRLFEQETVLADTLEALLGQIYRHLGFDVARMKFILWLETFMPEVWTKEASDFDPKSRLQERSLAMYKKLPTYKAREEGQGFRVELWLNDELAASGVFSSKRGGEKELAQDVLKKGII